MNTPKRLLALPVFVVAVLSFASPILAQDQDAPALSCAAAPNQTYAGTLFTNVYTAAQAFSADLCAAYKEEIGDGSGNDYIAARVRGFLDASRKALDDRQLSESADYAPAFTALQSSLASINIRNLVLPQFDVEEPVGLGLGDNAASVPWGQFSPLDSPNAKFDINDSPVCAMAAAGMDCVDVFDDFSNAFNPYRGAYEAQFSNNAELLSGLTESWDRFLEISKSQTPLEVFLTTAANRGHFRKDYLVGPPPFQVIALHPDLAYNHISAAPDGSNDEFGVSVEWIGVNYWDKKVPIGISLASVYVDRAGVRDVGHGVQLHLYNSYAIGWADHDGESSFYFNIDLLKFFQDRKAKYEAYLNQYF